MRHSGRRPHALHAGHAAVRPGAPALEVCRGKAEDLPEIARLHADDEPGRADWSRRFEAVPRRVWFAREPGGAVVASAHTHVEAEQVAMVGGVFTRPDARGRGWAASCLAALCAELRAEGRLPCLYHDHRGPLYQRLGFRPGGPWRLSQVAPQPG